MGPGKVSLRVLGRMRLFSGDSEVPLPARQVRRLMAALAVAGGRARDASS